MIPISKPLIGDEEKKAVLEVMDSGMLVQGPRTAALEEEFAKVCGVKHAIATSSGTTALHVALLAHGIGPGDEVVTTPFSFIASTNSIVFTGAKPVFADIEEDTFNLDPKAIEAAITPKTKAILLVHLYGLACDMDRIQAIAKKHNLAVIEDSAQAIGTTHKGKHVGSFGTGAFSLYATKNVSSAEGGMVTTNDDAIAESCRLIRSHGSRRRYYHDIVGFNFRMTDIHAAIGLAQLKKLDMFTSKRRQNAKFLCEHLSSVKTPKMHAEHAWHQYTVRLAGARAEERDKAVEKLTKAGVGSGVFYPVPIHQQKHLIDLGLGGARMPVAEKIANEVFSLPVHPALSGADLEKIVHEVNTL